MRRIKKTQVVQLIDRQAYEEHFDGVFPWEALVHRFEADTRKNALADGENPPIYAGVVSIDRYYGGPEEGGWYYDWHQVEEILECQDFRHLLSTVRSLREQYPTCQRGRGSVIGGTDTVIYISRNKKLIENCQSEERPRYE